jgi:integrase
MARQTRRAPARKRVDPRRNARVQQQPHRRVTQQQLLDASIKDSTRLQYESRLKVLQVNGYALDFDGLCTRFCELDGVGIGVLKDTISAVQWHRRKNRLEPISDADVTYLRKMLVGRNRLTGGTKQKGAVTQEKLEQFLDWLEKPAQNTTAAERWAIEVCWATALRTSQMEQLERNHFVRNKNGYVLYTNQIHSPTRGMRTNCILLRTNVHQRVWYRLTEFLRLHRDDEKLFPSWDPIRLNDLLQRASRQLKWDTNVTWKGMHNLRHGVATEVAATQGMDAARLYTRHAAPRAPVGTIANYVHLNQIAGAPVVRR